MFLFKSQLERNRWDFFMDAVPNEQNLMPPSSEPVLAGSP